MEDFLKNIKNKLSVDNIFSTEKAKEPMNLNRDEDLRRTIGTVDHNDMIDPEEIAAKLNEIHEQSKTALDELKVQSNKVIDSAKSQSSRIIDSAKSGFGVFQKTQPAQPETSHVDEEDPYTADVSTPLQKSLTIESADVVAKLDEIQVKSWSALDELMSQSNKIIDTAKFQSNQIIESALSNLTVIEAKSNHQNVSQDAYDPDDRILNFF